jgi:glucose/arabinose dehydrogenase
VSAGYADGLRGRWFLLGAFALLALLSAPGAARADLDLPAGFAEIPLAEGLADPTALAYAPDGRMFIAEKAGRVRVVSAAGSLRGAPVIDIGGHVATAGDRGLLGIAVDSDFATNGFVYLLYTYDEDAAHPTAEKTARLTRIKVLPDDSVANALSPETVLLGTTGTAPCPAPADTSDCMPSTSDSHTIGTVRADPDGTLWVGAGDGAQYNYMDPTALRAYDERSMAGKIMHVDRQGRGLPGHPFCPGVTDLTLVCTKLYAKGFRNPFRFQLRPGTTPVVGDVGWDTSEELDLIGPGLSYGWPCYEGTNRTVHYDTLPECQAEYATQPPSQTPPAYHYDRPYGVGGAIVAGPQYTGTRYSAPYRNAWFFGDYAQGWIKAYDLVNGTPTNVRTFAGSGFTGVDLETTPEGDLVYVYFGDGSANTGSVNRIVFGNAPPPATAHATPASGPSPLTVQLSADVAVDPDGDAVSYAWDFDSDGSTDATTRVASHVYTTSGVHTAALTVTDARGLASHDSVDIAVDEAPPVATIDAPVDGSLFRHGTPVPLRGSAHDAVDGNLTGDALQWRIVLHHGNHIHLVASGLPGAVQSFTPAGDHDADSYYEIEFTATDSAGQQDTRTVAIRPDTIALTLASSPPGATLSYSARAYMTPATLTSAIGYRTSVSAPEALIAGGTTYQFDSWSDGGARSHQFVIPAEDRTLTARYRAAGGTPAVPPGSAAEVLGSQTTGRALSAPRPRLRLDRPGRRTRTLRGRVSGVAAKPRVLVALRTVLSGGRCRRWSAVHGRLARRSRSCAAGHTWMRAAVTRTGASAWRWRVRLRGTPRAGRYVVSTRATDARGRSLIRSRSASVRLR